MLISIVMTFIIKLVTILQISIQFHCYALCNAVFGGIIIFPSTYPPKQNIVKRNNLQRCGIQESRNGVKCKYVFKIHPARKWLIIVTVSILM